MRNLARIVATGRAAFSVAYLAVPTRINESWLGETEPSAKSDLLGRSLAARDLALSAGALAALESEGGRPELWFAAHAVSDLTDLASTVAIRDRLPKGGRSSAAAAGLSALAAALVAAALVKS
ncbi:hypothetical protein BH10ACT11_BH10ACT11_10490 [soil metagenome]